MYSPPGLHRTCHSLHIPTNVWGAQDHESLVWSHVVGWPPLLPFTVDRGFSNGGATWCVIEVSGKFLSVKDGKIHARCSWHTLLKPYG